MAVSCTLRGPTLLAGSSPPAGPPGPHPGPILFAHASSLPGKSMGPLTHACAYVHSPPRALVNSSLSLSLVESHCVLQTSFFSARL